MLALIILCLIIALSIRSTPKVGTSRFMLVLIILCLFIALSIRTTPRGTGVFCGIQETCLLNSLRIISLLNIIVIPKGTGAFGELKIVLRKLFYLFLTCLVNYSHYSQRDGCFWGLADSCLF